MQPPSLPPLSPLEPPSPPPSRAPPLPPGDGSGRAGGEEAPAGRGDAHETGNSTGRGDGVGDNGGNATFSPPPPAPAYPVGAPDHRVSTAPPAGFIALLVVGFCIAAGAVYARYLHKDEFKFPGLAVISGSLPGFGFGRGRGRAAERYAGLNGDDDREVEMPSISL